MAVSIVIAFTFCVLYLVHFYWKVSKYPKGPIPWPIIGNLAQLPSDNFHVYLDELSKVYGPCYTIWIPLPHVVLTDYEHYKDAIVTKGDTFNYRSHRVPESLLHEHEGTGIGMSDGENWKIQRRTCLKILRDFGMGKQLMEQNVLKSAQEMLNHLEALNDHQHVDLFWPIQLCVGNVINELLFGYQYSHTDMKKFQHFVEVIGDHLSQMYGKCTSLIGAFPWMKYLPGIGEIGYHRIKRNIDTYQKFIEEEVAVQIKEYDGVSEPENFVHAYLEQASKSEVDSLDTKNLVANVVDFWMAGMETTSTALRWYFAYMLKYPDVQDKVRKEIQKHIGSSRLPSVADKVNMPYTQAVIHEVQRHSNMGPFLGSHVCHEDTDILGHQIPAETSIFPQIWSILRHDPVFKDPTAFNPERCLMEDGKTFNKTVLERTIPFSIGRRNCVGESLARMELFLISTTLLQKYELVATSEVDLTPEWGGVLTVKPYKCRFVKVNC